MSVHQRKLGRGNNTSPFLGSSLCIFVISRHRLAFD
jgi:hypothetical protein